MFADSNIRVIFESQKQIIMTTAVFQHEIRNQIETLVLNIDIAEASDLAKLDAINQAIKMLNDLKKEIE